MVGAGEKRGWASWFGRHKAPGHAHKPVLIFIAPQDASVPTEASGRLDKAAGHSQQTGGGPVMSSARTLLPLPLGSRDCRRMAHPYLGRGTRLGQPSLSRPETTGDPEGLGEEGLRAVRQDS